MKYQRITIRSGEEQFSVFCTQESLEHRRDEVLRWAERFAGHLHWRTFETTFTSASVCEAIDRPHALFEHRFPNPL